MMIMQVAVPYWYYVRKLGRRIVRYSKIMAHDEGNTANVSSFHRKFDIRCSIRLCGFFFARRAK